jgi:hypothetical protein
MHRLFASLAALTAFGAHAAENPAPQPIAPSLQATAKAELRRAPPPTMSVMRVTRQADGTLVTDCVQRPNPRAHVKAPGAQP